MTHLSITKVVVKVNRRGIRAPEYLQRFDSPPIPMITNRQLALLMADSLPKALSDFLHNALWSPQLESVHVSA